MKKVVIEKSYAEIAKELAKLKEEYDDLEIKTVRCLNGKYNFILRDSEKELKLVGINRKHPNFKDLYKLADYKVNHFKVIPTAICLATTTFMLANPLFRPYMAEAKEIVKETPQEVNNFMEEKQIDSISAAKDYVKESAQIMVDFMQMAQLEKKLASEPSSIYVDELYYLVCKCSKYEHLSSQQKIELTKYINIVQTFGQNIVHEEQNLISLSGKC